MDLNVPRFTNPKGSSCSATKNLYVANCGPAVGISFEDIKCVFSNFGEVLGIHIADDSGTRVIVCYSELTAAEAAFRTLNGFCCAALGGRILRLRYSIMQHAPKGNGNDSLCAALFSSELEIPGIYLVHDFITSEEEQELLTAVDCKPWKNLSKRRVQHYGYEFLYETRNVDTKKFLGELPHFVSPIIKKISSFEGMSNNNGQLIDQLTVNDYPLGIGLSPHIDTHSAFDDTIFSLSLAGPCIMEFRKYSLGSCHSRKAIFLPPRSLLMLSGEGRYAWHHYIPHHKVYSLSLWLHTYQDIHFRLTLPRDVHPINIQKADTVRGKAIRRCSRRVSFTFRKIRSGPCQCEFSQYCDSQKEI